MARTMERHCDDLLHMTREERESKARVTRACATLPVDQADKVCREEFARQRDLRESAKQAVKEQLDRG